MSPAAAAPDRSRSRALLNSPLALACAYLCFGLAWLWASGRLAAALAHNAEELAQFESAKGSLFMVASACALYLWVAAARRLHGRLPEVEHKLHETEEQIHSLAESAPDAITVHDAHRIYYANPAFRRLFELPDDADLSTLRLRHLIDPEQLDVMVARVTRVARDIGATSPMEFRCRTARGNIVEVEHASCSVRLDGMIIVQSHLRDLTARNAARRELEQLNSELELRVRDRTADLLEANRALESFTYSVAHDLRAPVGRLDGFATVLAESIASGESSRALHYANRIKANATVMAGMIEGLLQVSRADRAILHVEPLDTRRLVETVLDEMDKPVRAVVQLGSLPSCLGDAPLLRQVWTNLLSNAIKYSSQAPQPLVRVEGEARVGECVFSVSDNGVGFDPQEAAQLFQTFQRLSTGLAFSGTGVGLTVVRRIVQRHGGRVWAEGAAGQGATFFFSLPCAALQAQVRQCCDAKALSPVEHC